MSYRVELTHNAKGEFDALPQSVQSRVNRLFDVLAEDPGPPKFKPMVGKGLKGPYRIHAGPDYVIGYDIDDARRNVRIWKIGRRDRFYEEAKRQQRRT